MDIRERLINIINSWKDKKIAIIGDLMIDEYIIGKIERISPEAPVPILEVEEEKYVLGGASNVANNIKSLGGDPILIGVIGEDKGGEKVINLLEEKKIKNYLIIDNLRPTTTKTRLISLGQQIVRMDREKKSPISQEIEEKIIDYLTEIIDNIELIILSDYAKGVLTPSLTQRIISLSLSKNKKLVADPKGRDYSKYKGVSFITPNEKEAKIASNMEEDFDLIICAQRLNEIIKGEGIIITRGENGMFFYSQDYYYFIPALKVEVRDVTGAGDTVISAFALALSNDATPLEASIISNFAASCVVRKLGTSTVTTSELISTIPQRIEINGHHVSF